jgi:hypothetical protein
MFGPEGSRLRILHGRWHRKNHPTSQCRIYIYIYVCVCACV